ncbi:H(+)-transporting ATP synthase, vacuolar type, subunit D [Thermanaerovibrio velox DSM 12556]|jgi:V/A-type H+-transporting ATPase subunit D|uniref:V-type ATP synthase subunit D n=1 Tax=Thermanaerovibrio velox DSM 12556 TaxID=926567 RepID=H0URQ0_9BACT|nr:V-type ATP synthase subunit D [Thermanaerovibrio velox]EHM09989.1 H(+)-transporting ATP synthase, vacuolar type, subunit D [Thermanaerovibrio velox DSM 12556]MCX7827872.1 V-type ATP synthase subunit D [Thermanaerothrix sp.]
MAKALNVNPNRMELSRLKKRLVVAKRGHKLLKDKQDALIKEFLQRARDLKNLREEVEGELRVCYQSFLLARSQSLPSLLEQALLLSSGGLGVEEKRKNVMSVSIPLYTLSERAVGLTYGLLTSSGSLDVTLEKFESLLPKLVRLAAEEKALRLMAKEIEKTRRRVNALEYVLIPSFIETIKNISMKLDEMERATLGRLMRIKEIVRSH